VPFLEIIKPRVGFIASCVRSDYFIQAVVTENLNPLIHDDPGSLAAATAKTGVLRFPAKIVQVQHKSLVAKGA
jgi:hypothetical protein